MADRHDVLLGSDGDLPVVARHGNGLDLVVQRIFRRLSVVKGEWFLDTSSGLPYFDWRAAKPLPEAEIMAKVRKEVEGCPGVARTRDWSASFDRETRTFTTNLTVVTDGGEAVLRFAPIGEPGSGNTNPSLRLISRGAR